MGNFGARPALKKREKKKFKYKTIKSKSKNKFEVIIVQHNT
jgi:hypothetical protein